jgi:hypothetical protein
VAEELAFRGYLYRAVIARRFQDVPVGRLAWPALVVSSVLFGLLHERWLAGAAAGAVYALLMVRSDRSPTPSPPISPLTSSSLFGPLVVPQGDSIQRKAEGANQPELWAEVAPAFGDLPSSGRDRRRAEPIRRRAAIRLVRRL